MFDLDDELENRAEYAEGEIIAERIERSGLETCPDCGELITDLNPLISEIYSPEDYGYCQDCYDPTPAGPEYSPGFEMNH